MDELVRPTKWGYTIEVEDITKRPITDAMMLPAINALIDMLQAKVNAGDIPGGKFKIDIIASLVE